jgi:transposase InsO family protein
MRLCLEQRSLIADARSRGIKISRIAEVFGISQTTVKRWSKRKRFTDKKRKPKESKVTLKVELAILAMRTTFRWGTARIQQGLINLPDFAKEALQNYVENTYLSRTKINDILKKHKLNGYLTETKKWKFFRAKKPNELWQLDPKGPFIVQGKKYWFIICIDDYSRYMLIAEQLDHSPSTQDITNMLDKLSIMPENILTDNAKLFAKQWKHWCRDNGIKPLYAHPYYPQDKGKVERAIRNISEEFIHLMKKFPEWLNGVISDYKKWFNDCRFHRGIGTVPSALYGTLET